jgi:predicted glycosyltransferase
LKGRKRGTAIALTPTSALAASGTVTMEAAMLGTAMGELLPGHRHQLASG